MTPPTPVPSPSGSPGLSTDVVPGPHSGPTTITFEAAEPSPGSTLSGCGPTPAGCTGRVRIRFRLLSSSGGPVLRTVVFLHATNKLACLQGSTPPFSLPANQPQVVEVALDRTDPVACSTPLTIANMATVVEGTIEVASRQEWSLALGLNP